MNVDELTEEYGNELSEKINDEINFCKEREMEYRIEIIDETDYTTTISFSTYAYSKIYNVSKDRKHIIFKNSIGYNECKNIIKSMDVLNIEQKKKQQAR